MISLLIDSVNFDGDSIYYPHSHWMTDESLNCIMADSTSVLGKEIRVSSSGLYSFVLASGDTLFLDTQLELQEQVVAYTSSDGFYEVLIGVGVESQEVVFEEVGLETIKSYYLLMYDSTGMSIDHPVNDKFFRTGSQSGIISFPNLSSFPDFTSFPMHEMPHQLDIKGISPDLGIQEITTFEIFDFQVGDIIHYETGSSNFGELDLEQFAVEYLDRSDYADSIVYEVEVSLYLNGSPEPSSIWTEMRTVERLLYLEVPAGGPIVQGGLDATGDLSFLVTHPDFGTAKKFNHLGPLYMFDNDIGCYTQIIDGTCFQNRDAFYYEGLGGPYYECSTGAPFSTWSRLIYFNKGGEEWGVPLSADEILVGNDFRIYPNPANSQFRIELSSRLNLEEVRIFDLRERLVKSFRGNPEWYSIDELNQGVYLIEIKSAEGQSITEKLLVN